MQGLLKYRAYLCATHMHNAVFTRFSAVVTDAELHTFRKLSVNTQAPQEVFAILQTVQHGLSDGCVGLAGVTNIGVGAF